jgi:4-nitrophenyl phosphatase
MKLNHHSLFLFDLDGTIYRGTEIIPGAQECIEELRSRGKKIAFITNSANGTPTGISKRLRGLGVPCHEDEVFSAGMVAARSLEPCRVFCLGGDGLRECLRGAGHTLASNEVNAVVVGLDKEFTYEKLTLASDLVRSGAKFIGTNPDLFYMTEKGPKPAGGILVQAVASSSGVTPTIVGKPHTMMLQAALDAAGASPESTVVIGDSLQTDIPAGTTLGATTVLVLTGNTAREDLHTSELHPTHVLESCLELRELL